MTVGRPNQVWSKDITYLRLVRGFVYLGLAGRSEQFYACMSDEKEEDNTNQQAAGGAGFPRGRSFPSVPSGTGGTKES